MSLAEGWLVLGCSHERVVVFEALADLLGLWFNFWLDLYFVIVSKLPYAFDQFLILNSRFHEVELRVQV